jgi:hypothetical protein
MRENVTNDRSGDEIDSEHARIVAEVMQDQARRRAVREAADAARADESDTSFFVQVGLLVAGTFFFYLLFFSPAWIAPAASEPISVQSTEDGLRVAIYLTASQIEDFRNRQGRLPRSMAELSGDEEPSGARGSVRYERIGEDLFMVQASTGTTTLQYVSSEPLGEFVGDTWDRVLDGGGTS